MAQEVDRWFEYIEPNPAGKASVPAVWLDLSAVIAIRTQGDAMEFVLLSGISQVLNLPNRLREPLVTRWKAVREAHGATASTAALAGIREQLEGIALHLKAAPPAG